MTRTKSIIGALALCALSICAFAAVSASASELTAVTCKKIGVTGDSNSHCATGTTGEYKTEALPLNTTTSIEATSTEGEPTLRGTVSLVNLTVKCTTGHLLEGWVENKETSAGKHEAIGGGKITYTGCKAMLKANEARTCEVETITGPVPGETGKIATVTLSSATTGVNHQIKFQPKEGTTFSEFGIEPVGNECFFENTVKVPVTGTVECEANTTTHAHLTCTEENNGTALKVGGASAKYIDTVGANMTGEPETTVGATTFT
jgi:hypothetical protein